MPGLSNSLEAALLDWMFKQTAFPTAPTQLHYSLHSADPGDTGANEISGGGYARAQLNPDPNNTTNTNYSAKQTDGTSQYITNAADITFPQATANWNGGNAIQWVGVWSASSGGTFYASFQFQGSGVVVLNGNTLRLLGATGQLRFQID